MTMQQAISAYVNHKHKVGGHLFAAKVKNRADELMRAGETDDINEAMFLAVCENLGAKPVFAQ